MKRALEFVGACCGVFIIGLLSLFASIPWALSGARDFVHEVWGVFRR
jgi:hypothetical protein